MLLLAQTAPPGLVARLNVGETTVFQRARRALLAWCDVVMMRRQLRR
jgi:hypothetical protein